MSESARPAERPTSGRAALAADALAAEILDAHAEGRPPDTRGESAARCAAALDAVFARGQLEAAERTARSWREAFPRSRYIENLCAIFDEMPAADGSPAFRDDPTRDVQPVARAGADTAVLLFCGHSGRLGLPLGAMHRWLGRLPASLVYLRDPDHLFYLMGIRSLGAGRPATAAALRGLAASLGARRIVCYGNSGGAFAALLYAVELGADAVLSMSGVVNLAREFNQHLRPAVNIGRVWSELGDRPVELRALYASAARPPRARLVYAEHNWDDRLHAEHLHGLPTISLRAVAGDDGHNTAVELIRRREFTAELAWLITKT